MDLWCVNSTPRSGSGSMGERTRVGDREVLEGNTRSHLTFEEKAREPRYVLCKNELKMQPVYRAKAPRQDPLLTRPMNTTGIHMGRQREVCAPAGATWQSISMRVGCLKSELLKHSSLLNG